MWEVRARCRTDEDAAGVMDTAAGEAVVTVVAVGAAAGERL
jgi:hypothetical protein